MIKQTFDPKRHSIFVPKNPEKYKGKLPCIMRSDWELQFARWLDATPAILEWSSESLAIQYFNPVKQGMSRYYPDFIMKVKTKDDEIRIYIIEVKPFKETVPPTGKGKKSNKTKLNEETTYMKNLAKWQAAKAYCERHGYIFRILTERSMFIDANRKKK